MNPSADPDTDIRTLALCGGFDNNAVDLWFSDQESAKAKYGHNVDAWNALGGVLL